MLKLIGPPECNDFLPIEQAGPLLGISKTGLRAYIHGWGSRPRIESKRIGRKFCIRPRDAYEVIVAHRASPWRCNRPRKPRTPARIEPPPPPLIKREKRPSASLLINLARIVADDFQATLGHPDVAWLSRESMRLELLDMVALNQAHAGLVCFLGGLAAGVRDGSISSDDLAQTRMQVGMYLDALERICGGNDAINQTEA